MTNSLSRIPCLFFDLNEKIFFSLLFLILFVCCVFFFSTTSTFCSFEKKRKKKENREEKKERKIMPLDREHNYGGRLNYFKSFSLFH